MSSSKNALRALGRSRTTRTVFSAAFMLITGAVLFWMVYRQRQALLEGAWRFHPGNFFLSILLFGATLLSAALMWAWMMNALGTRLPLGKHLRYYLISNVTKRLPGTLWYIAGRAYWYAEEGVDGRVTSLTSAVEYAVMALSGALCGLVFSLSLLRKVGVNPWLVVALLPFSLVLLHPRLLHRLFAYLKVEIQTLPMRTVIAWLVCYCGVWILGGLTLFMMVGAVYPLALSQAGYVIGSYVLVGMLSLALVFVPTTLGVSEVGIGLLLGAVMPSSLAVVAAVLSRIAQTVLEMLLAGWFYLARRFK